MARVAFCGFEWGANAEMASITTNTSFVASPVNPGGSAFALRVNPATTNVGSADIRTFAANGAPNTNYSVATAYHTFYFRYATAPAANDEQLFVSYQQTGSTMKFNLRLNSAGKLVAYDSANTSLGTGSTALSANTWYMLDVKVGTGASAAWEVKINGTSELSGGTANLLTNNNAGCSFGKKVNFNGNTVDFFYDDVWIDDAAYKGAHVVVPKVPTANGSTMQWTAGTGSSDWTTVDEIPPSSADYVQSTASGDVALFAMQDAATAPAVSGTIHSVLVMTRCRENAAGVSDYRTRLRSNATNSDTTGVDPGASSTTNAKYVDLDPNTGSAWTTGGIDAVECGALDNASNPLRCETVTLMVSFTAAAAATTTFPVTILLNENLGVGHRYPGLA